MTSDDLPYIILKAADRLLARYGYRKMTMDDLAREAGIGKGTIYLHFSSKQDVALSHVDQIVAELMEQLWKIARSRSSFAQKTTDILVERVLFRFDRVQNYSESLDDLLVDVREGLLYRRRGHFKQEEQVLLAVLKEGNKAGAFTVRAPVETAHALLLATNALLPYSLSVEDLGARQHVEKEVRQLASLLLRGLLTRRVRVKSAGALTHT